MLLLLLASKLWIMSTSWRTFSKVGWLYLFWMKDADIHVHRLDSTITTEQSTSAGLLYQFCFYIVQCYFMRLVPLLSTGLHWSWVDKYIMRMTGKKFIIASARSENSLWLKCYCNQKSILLFLCISKLFVTKPLSDWRFLSLHFKKTPFILTEIFLINGLGTITNFKILRELDRGWDDIKDSLHYKSNACPHAQVYMQRKSFELSDLQTRLLHVQ